MLSFSLNSSLLASLIIDFLSFNLMYSLIIHYFKAIILNFILNLLLAINLQLCLLKLDIMHHLNHLYL